MGIKLKLKRGIVKAHRKVLGKPTDIMITTGKGGLTSSEIKDVLQTLTSARKQGLLTPLSFEFKPPIRFLDNREPLFLTPKDGNVLKARVQIKQLVNARYGNQFMVDGGKAISRKTVVRNKTSVPSRRGIRITPKTPRLRK